MADWVSFVDVASQPLVMVGRHKIARRVEESDVAGVGDERWNGRRTHSSRPDGDGW